MKGIDDSLWIFEAESKGEKISENIGLICPLLGFRQGVGAWFIESV